MSFDRDQIPVGRERLAPVRAHRSRPAAPASAASAGTMLIATLVLFVIAGAELGRLIAAPIAGGIVGGFTGVIAGFCGIYLRFRSL